MRSATILAVIGLSVLSTQVLARDLIHEVVSEREINGLSDQLLDGASNSLILGARAMLSARADFFENLAKTAYSQFGAANSSGISAADRKAIQSYYSSLSKEYRAASLNSTNAEALLKKATTNFGGIPDKFHGVPINANPLAVIMAVADVGLAEWERAQLQKQYPDIRLEPDPYAMTLDGARSFLNGLTFGAVKVVSLSYDVHDEMPSDTKSKKNWLADMESYAQYWTNEARRREGTEDYVPVGILQYLKIRKSATNTLFDKYGLPLPDSQFSWIDEWSLLDDGGNLRTARASQPRAIEPQLNKYFGPYAPPKWDADKPFIPALSGTADQPFELDSHYAQAPDLTEELQAEFIEEAQPIDPPPTATWAGRMSLSGRYTIGLNPATGVVEAMEASGKAPISQFILFNPDAGTMTQPIQGVQSTASIGHSFNHLMWGNWTGGSRQWTNITGPVAELSGFFVYGELTPPTARSSGVATYTGRLRGDVIEEGGVIQSGLAFGDFGLTANFGTGVLGGWLAIAADNSANYVFVSDITNAIIVRQSDNLHFYGDLGSNYNDTTGRIDGYFFGQNATELGGTYEVTNSNGQGSSHGILLGWETGSMPTKPVFADGSKRAHISTQTANGYILDSSLDTLTVPAQGQPSVALAVPQEQGGGTVSTSQVYARNGYSYTSWGKWRANDSTPDSYSNGGYWAAGDATSGSVIQNKSGSATYSGEIIGDHVSNGVRQAAEGSIHLTADFNADRISGDMEFHTETTSMTPAPIDTAIQGSGYFGQISNDSANGNFGYGVQGNFFGPNADEIGGSAWASTDEGTYNGVFRAKQ